MAMFHSTGETFKRKSKNSGPGDSPYHIFTPDDRHVQHETADTCTFSTFYPQQPQHKGSSTNTGNSFMASLPLNYRSTTNKEDSFSSSLPRYGSHGSKTVHYNRSMDNIAVTFVKSLPPRGQYHPSTTDTKPNTTKSLQSRQERHHRLNFPQPSITPTSQRNDLYVDEFDIDSPEGLSHDNESLQRPKNVIHRNAAYESVVRRPFQEIGYRSPVFDIEVEREEFATDSGASSNQQTHGSGTNFFEMYSDDGSKNDLNQFCEQSRIKISSSHSLNDYENVKEAFSSKTCSDHAAIPKPEHNVSSTSSMETIDEGPSVQEYIQESIEKPTAYIFKPDYENIKEYTSYEEDDMREWIPLAAVPTAVPQLDLEMNQLAEVPKIVVDAEHDKANEDLSEVQNTEQSELLQGIASLGTDLRKSVDVETLSDYEEMASSFSSHYNQQTFPFLSSTETEGVQATVKQKDDEQNLSTIDPTEDTQHNKQASLETKGNQQPIVHKNKKAKCFQCCLIFITFAIATAALVMSTLVYIRKGDNNFNMTMSNTD